MVMPNSPPQDQTPYREALPKAFDRPIERERFEDYVPPDYFWPIANWVFGAIISLMGVCALKDMFTSNYNWLLALSWVSTACLGLGALAFIHKWILGK